MAYKELYKQWKKILDNIESSIYDRFKVYSDIAVFFKFEYGVLVYSTIFDAIEGEKVIKYVYYKLSLMTNKLMLDYIKQDFSEDVVNDMDELLKESNNV